MKVLAIIWGVLCVGWMAAWIATAIRAGGERETMAHLIVDILIILFGSAVVGLLILAESSISKSIPAARGVAWVAFGTLFISGAATLTWWWVFRRKG